MITPARPGEGPPQRLARADFDRSPLLVFYEVTQACDLVCQHCRACAQTTRHPSELSTLESLRLIDQLSEFPNPPMLVMTGGDPLKRADIYRLIEHAAWAGLDVSITPSATPLMTNWAIHRLRDAGISRMAISIDGADAQTHDAVRGVAGSFDRSLEILTTARNAGISTQVNTTLTPDNVDQIDRLAAQLADLKIDMWSVFFLVPVGRADQMARLSSEGCEQAFAKLWHHSQTQPYLVKTTEAPHYRRFAIQHRIPRGRQSEEAAPKTYIPFGVNDGKGVMFVSHAGVIHPSGFMPIVCGVFPHQHVVRVYQDSTMFRALRDANQLHGKCGECEYRNLCGGSRARAFAVTGDPLASEPDCVYIPPKEKGRRARQGATGIETAATDAD